MRSVRLSMSPPNALEWNASAEPVAEDLVAPGTSTFDASDAGVEPDRGLAPVPDDACVRADFAAWLERTAVAAAECSRWLEVVPTVRAEGIAAEARRALRHGWTSPAHWTAA